MCQQVWFLVNLFSLASRWRSSPRPAGGALLPVSPSGLLSVLAHPGYLLLLQEHQSDWIRVYY